VTHSGAGSGRHWSRIARTEAVTRASE
jgi:hypothetical protein